ncbi:MAG: DUF3189 family protein [Syntrophomonadaceae bacterium]|nr:DUF3189 family protein [Syntrophomonadaceae bacterium]
MIIVLAGVTAVHHTMVTAHLYLNGTNEVDFSRIKGYGDMSLDAKGTPILIGTDEKGNSVYTLGVGGNIEVGYRAMTEFLQIMSVPVDVILVYPVRLPVETIIWLITKVNCIPWGVGSALNLAITKLLLNRYVGLIQSAAEDLRLQVKNQLASDKSPIIAGDA